MKSPKSKVSNELVDFAQSVKKVLLVIRHPQLQTRSMNTTCKCAQLIITHGSLATHSSKKGTSLIFLITHSIEACIA